MQPDQLVSFLSNYSHERIRSILFKDDQSSSKYYCLFSCFSNVMTKMQITEQHALRPACRRICHMRGVQSVRG